MHIGRKARVPFSVRAYDGDPRPIDGRFKWVARSRQICPCGGGELKIQDWLDARAVNSMLQLSCESRVGIAYPGKTNVRATTTIDPAQCCPQRVHKIRT
jgi:hypothetical protein